MVQAPHPSLERYTLGERVYDLSHSGVVLGGVHPTGVSGAATKIQTYLLIFLITPIKPLMEQKVWSKLMGLW